MTRRYSIVFSALIVTALSFAGCKKDDAGNSNPPAGAETKGGANKAPEPAKQPNKPTLGETNDDVVGSVMKHYEECRSLLAADKTDSVSECAAGMSAAAKSGAASAPAAAKPHLATIVEAADALAKAPAEDVDAVRLAYGKVSEPVVALLTAVPAAAKDYHVFECPMAKGYKRWAQPEAKLANPYMGTKMLACGSEVHDHHKGMMDKGDGADHAGHGMEHDEQ